MSNMDFWNRVMKTDPARVKPITGKQYKGNSPQPYYLVERMTAEFGMCGIGWGIEILSERMERLSDTDVLHIAHVELWYEKDGKTGRIQQVGQTKAAYMSSKNALIVDEDAPKKSVTDAMTKCMSYLGFSGDIFSGHWDDSKYVEAVRKEFEDAKAEQQRAEDIAEATRQINDADSADSLKAVFAGWWKYFDAAGQEAIKPVYEAKRDSFDNPQQEAA